MASRSLNPQKMKDFAKKKIFNQKTKFKYIVSLRRHIWTASKQRNDCILFFGCVKFRQTARHCLNDEFPIFWWNSAWVVWCIKCGWHFCAAQPFFPPAVHKTSVCNQTMQKIMPVGGQKMDRQTDRRRKDEDGWRILRVWQPLIYLLASKSKTLVIEGKRSSLKLWLSVTRLRAVEMKWLVKFKEMTPMPKSKWLMRTKICCKTFRWQLARRCSKWVRLATIMFIIVIGRLL